MRLFCRFFGCEIYNAENAMKLSVLLMMGTLLSCTATPTPAAPESWSLAVTSAGGLAGRGAGSFSINDKGAISVTTITDRTCTFQASESERQTFASLVAAARPAGWKPSYKPEEDCCDRIEYDLTLIRDGAEAKTSWIDEPLPMPEDLSAITNALINDATSIRVLYGARCQ
jgi:hypothetical protein